jgi:hypothetical protein
MGSVVTPLATVSAMANLDLVGVKEIAERLGVPRGTVSIWKLRGLMPLPEVELGSGPVWRWSKISKWARETNRLPKEEE